jgi:hypothetical protein
MAEVHINLASISENKHLAVLNRIHSAGVDIQITIALDCNNLMMVLQKTANRGGRGAFA